MAVQKINYESVLDIVEAAKDRNEGVYPQTFEPSDLEGVETLVNQLDKNVRHYSGREEDVHIDPIGHVRWHLGHQSDRADADWPLHFNALKLLTQYNSARKPSGN